MPVSLRPSRLLKLSPLFLLIALSACASAPLAPPVVQVADSSCKAFRTITWDLDDTPETSSQVRRHNRTLSEICRKR
jgi:hypothetical protein